MFQNVLNDYEQENYYEIDEEKSQIKNIIKKWIDLIESI